MGSVVEGKIQLGRYKCCCFKCTFVVNLDEIDGGRGSTRYYTYAKLGRLGSGIEFSEDG